VVSGPRCPPSRQTNVRRHGAAASAARREASRCRTRRRALGTHGNGLHCAVERSADPLEAASSWPSLPGFAHSAPFSSSSQKSTTSSSRVGAGAGSAASRSPSTQPAVRDRSPRSPEPARARLSYDVDSLALPMRTAPAGARMVTASVSAINRERVPGHDGPLETQRIEDAENVGPCRRSGRGRR